MFREENFCCEKPFPRHFCKPFEHTKWVRCQIVVRCFPWDCEEEDDDCKCRKQRGKEQEKKWD